MGWSWAVILIATARRYQLSGLDGHVWLQDREPVAPLCHVSRGESRAGVKILYIDNYGIIATDDELAKKGRNRMNRCCQDLGLAHTEEPDGLRDLIGLGLQDDRQSWRLAVPKI